MKKMKNINLTGSLVTKQRPTEQGMVTKKRQYLKGEAQFKGAKWSIRSDKLNWLSEAVLTKGFATVMPTVQPAVCIEPRDYDLMRTQHAASQQFKILWQQSQHVRLPISLVSTF